jgi:hypothetical protein
MKSPRKSAIVSKKITDEIITNASRWTAFLVASGTPYENLSDEWVLFFSAQAEIETASTELVRLIDAAISKDEKR